MIKIESGNENKVTMNHCDNDEWTDWLWDKMTYRVKCHGSRMSLIPVLWATGELSSTPKFSLLRRLSPILEEISAIFREKEEMSIPAQNLGSSNHILAVMARVGKMCMLYMCRAQCSKHAWHSWYKLSIEKLWIRRLGWFVRSLVPRPSITLRGGRPGKTHT